MGSVVLNPRDMRSRCLAGVSTRKMFPLFCCVKTDRSEMISWNSSANSPSSASRARREVLLEDERATVQPGPTLVPTSPRRWENPFVSSISLLPLVEALVSQEAGYRAGERVYRAEAILRHLLLSNSSSCHRRCTRCERVVKFLQLQETVVSPREGGYVTGCQRIEPQSLGREAGVP